MNKKTFIKLISILLSVVIMISSSIIFAYAEDTTLDSTALLTVKYLNIGQGDCILIYMPTGETMLIDAGYDGNSSLLNPSQHLEAENIDEIDYFVTTHPDKDHIWYAEDIINTHYITSESVIMPEKDNTSQMYSSLIDAIDGMNYLKYYPTFNTNSDGKLIPDTIVHNADLDFKVDLLGPVKTYTSNNNNSIIVKITYKNNSFLFTGDAEAIAEKDLINSYDSEVLRCDVLKCGHHGSSTSSSLAFLDATLPQYAIISCGLDNKYGHPASETVTNLKCFGAKIYRTDQIGTITAVSDGNKINITGEKPLPDDEETSVEFCGEFLKWEIKSNTYLSDNKVLPSYEYYPNKPIYLPLDNYITRDSNTTVDLTFLSSLNEYSIRSNKWLRSKPTDEKYWLFKVSTIGFYDVCMSAAGKVTSAGPKYFDVEYSLNGNDWTKITDFYFETATSKFENLLFFDECHYDVAFYLPKEAENQREVYIRFLLTSDERCVPSTQTTISDKSYFDLNNIVLSGNNEPTLCTVRFKDTEGNTCGKQQATLNKCTSEFVLPNLENDDYIRYFLGWYTDDIEITDDIAFNFNETSITGDTTFYPLYTGDTDGNGKLDLNDVKIILNHLTGINAVTSKKQTYACDIDLDTAQDLLDVNETVPTDINLLDAYILYTSYIIGDQK